MGTLVCAVDDSSEAREALRIAARLSRDAGFRLVVVHVEDTVGAGSEFRRGAHERGRALVERLLAAQGLDGEVDRRIEAGSPAKELARVAEEEAATLVLVGSRRRRWWRRGASRLTADLSATVGCPVVVVPPAAPR